MFESKFNSLWSFDPSISIRSLKLNQVNENTADRELSFVFIVISCALSSFDYIIYGLIKKL